MSQNQQFIQQQDWNGPFKARVNHNRSTRDGCDSSINNHAAFKPYSSKEDIKLKIRHSGTTITFETYINHRNRGNRASFPIKQRERLGVSPEDEITFWVKDVEGRNENQRVAIKPSSNVYHHVSESGEILCNHGDATKPGTSDNGFMVAQLETQDGEWRVCSVCENLNGAPDITYKNAMEVVRQINNLERDSKTFNTDELMQIAQNTAQTKKDYKMAIENVVSGQ